MAGSWHKRGLPSDEGSGLAHPTRVNEKSAWTPSEGIAMQRLTGRVALVTGRQRNRAKTAERLAEEGASVLVTDVQDDAGQQLPMIEDGGGTAAYAHLDVTSPISGTQPASAVDQFGSLDILVNNAGME